MNRGHLILIFVFLFVLLSLSTVEQEWQYNMAEKQKTKIDEALLFASDTAAEQLVRFHMNDNRQNLLDNAEREFFRALSAGMGVYDMGEEEDALNFYVPLLLVTDTEGFYINYLQEKTLDGAKSLVREWSECQPYYYADSEFIYRFYLNDVVYIIRKSDPADVVVSSYEEVVSNSSLMSQLSSSAVFRSESDFNEVKRAAIAQCIERAVGRVMNEHNYIAGQYGISMYYSVPSFFERYTPALEYASFLAVFQGYPLSVKYNIIYNNCSTSAAYITKKNMYVVELSNSMAQPFSVYHKDGCAGIGAYGMVLDGKVARDEAVSVYGAYACPDCFTDEEGHVLMP